MSELNSDYMRGKLPSAYDDCDKNPHTKHDTTLDRPVYNISVPVINSSWTRVLISASEHGYVWANSDYMRGKLPSAYDDCDKNPHTKHDTTLDRPVYNISVPVINSLLALFLF